MWFSQIELLLFIDRYRLEEIHFCVIRRLSRSRTFVIFVVETGKFISTVYCILGKW